MHPCPIEPVNPFPTNCDVDTPFGPGVVQGRMENEYILGETVKVEPGESIYMVRYAKPRTDPRAAEKGRGYSYDYLAQHQLTRARSK